MPRRGVGRGGLTEGEACELEERKFNRDVAVAGRVVVELALDRRRAHAARNTKAARPTEGRELEVGLAEGADHAVFRRGAGIDGQRQTRTVIVEVRIAVADRAFTVPERAVVDAAVDRQVGAQITTQLDAGVGARNVEETGTIQGADPHVLDRFGLDGKISCLSPTHGDQTRR